MNLETLTADRAELWKRLFGQTSPALLKSFKAFHAENLHIYQAFEEKAKAAKASGRAKYSHWVIINVMRWEHDMQTTGVEFRISNDHIALYARLFVWRNPEFEGFFDLKQMNPNRAAKMNTELKEAA